MEDFNTPIPPNPYESDDEKAIVQQLQGFESQAHEGALIADLMRHPGFKPFKKWLDDQAMDVHGRWLTASDADALKLRHQAQVYQEVANWFNSRIAKGTAASKAIEQHLQEQKQL